MGIEDMDPSLLQDFLTESGELIERLDADLVTLESLGEGSEQKDLLDQIFRALHTIKGAASFLGLTVLTTFAHAAEDALNNLRKGDVKVAPDVMDILLQSVDVLRSMLVEVDGGQPITPGSDELVAKLHTIVGDDHAEADRGAEPQQPATALDEEVEGGRKLDLPPEKADLLEFMVIDLEEALQQLDQCLDPEANKNSWASVSQQIIELAENVFKTAYFFGLDSLPAAAKLMQDTAASLPTLSEEVLGEVLVRYQAIRQLIDWQAQALRHEMALDWPLETFQQRLESLAENKPLDEEIAGKHGGDPKKVLLLDGVIEEGAESQKTPSSGDGPSNPNETSADQARTAAKQTGGDAPTKRTSLGEQTIRVEVSRLEALLNLVGRLVLNKNRILSMTRKIREHGLPHEIEEHFAAAASDLDQLTGELQLGVMRTRMQPLAKLFDRYPRVIRDIARMTDKKIDLEVFGKETEVDKSVLEVLADPLMHILRNSADHGVETPEVRTGARKRETGTIRLTAEHQGSHVRVEIADDGKGLDREVLGKKAVEKGLTTDEQLPSLTDDEVFRFIFAAGFSTAEKVSDLSGRGVGMDVVRTNIAKINGAINISSAKGKGTTIEILIPLTVAIMPAMMVGVGQHLYAVPLTSITEIVRPEGEMVHSVAGQPVMRLRNSVLPLLNMREKLQESGSGDTGKFAVVVAVGQQRAGLVVDRLIGQQEIVIKPLDDRYTMGGPFSGATIREDGDVSLILDVIQLIRQAQMPERTAA